MKYLWSGLAAGLLSASHAGAVEFIETDQILNDDYFYRAVACGAAPGADCTRQFARWPAEKARELTVSLRGIDPEFPVYKLSWVRAALDEAIDEINKAGAAINLVRRADALSADIPIFLTGAGRGEVVQDTGYHGLDGSTIEAGLVTVWWWDGDISTAAVALSADVRRRSIRSILLEELVQALGLATDIRGPAYRGKSIFDEDSNAVTRLEGQDREALRRHYPTDSQMSQSASN